MTKYEQLQNLSTGARLDFTINAQLKNGASSQGIAELSSSPPCIFLQQWQVQSSWAHAIDDFLLVPHMPISPFMKYPQSLCVFK